MRRNRRTKRNRATRADTGRIVGAVFLASVVGIPAAYLGGQAVGDHSTRAATFSASPSCQTGDAQLFVHTPLVTAIPEQREEIGKWLAADTARLAPGRQYQTMYRDASGEITLSAPGCHREYPDTTFMNFLFRPTAARQKDSFGALKADVAADREPVFSSDAPIGTLSDQIEAALSAARAKGVGLVELTLVTSATGLGRIDDRDFAGAGPMRLVVVEPGRSVWREGEAATMTDWARSNGHALTLIHAPDRDGCLPGAEAWVILLDTTDPIDADLIGHIEAFAAAHWDDAADHDRRVSFRTIGATSDESQLVFSKCKGRDDTGRELARQAWQAVDRFEAGTADPWSSPRSAITETAFETYFGAMKSGDGQPVIAGISVVSDFLLNDAASPYRNNRDLDAGVYLEKFAEVTGLELPRDGVLEGVRRSCLYLTSPRLSEHQTPQHRGAVETIFGCEMNEKGE